MRLNILHNGHVGYLAPSLIVHVVRTAAHSAYTVDECLELNKVARLAAAKRLERVGRRILKDIESTMAHEVNG